MNFLSANDIKVLKGLPNRDLRQQERRPFMIYWLPRERMPHILDAPRMWHNGTCRWMLLPQESYSCRKYSCWYTVSQKMCVCQRYLVCLFKHTVYQIYRLQSANNSLLHAVTWADHNVWQWLVETGYVTPVMIKISLLICISHFITTNKMKQNLHCFAQFPATAEQLSVIRYLTTQNAPNEMSLGTRQQRQTRKQNKHYTVCMTNIGIDTLHSYIIIITKN